MKYSVKKSAFSLIELLVVVAVIGILSVMIIPEVRSARVRANGKTCTENLRTLQSAKFAWNSEHPGKLLTDVAQLMPYLKFGMPKCPDGGVAYENVLDFTHVVTCVHNGDPIYETSNGLDATKNGYHDLEYTPDITLGPLVADSAPSNNGGGFEYQWGDGNSLFNVVIVSDPPAGGVTTGGGKYHAQDLVTFTALANATYLFTGWSVSGGMSVINSPSQTSRMPSNDVLLTAHFILISDPGGSVGGDVGGAPGPGASPGGLPPCFVPSGNAGAPPTSGPFSGAGGGPGAGADAGNGGPFGGF